MSDDEKMPIQVEMFDIPEVDDEKYSIKSDALATALLGEHIKPTYKRCFEGILTKIKKVDIDSFIEADKPLRIRLSPKDYNSMFPKDSKGVSHIFESAADYYSANTTLKIPKKEDPTKFKNVNVVDSAEVLDSGELEILFTRSILTHLSDVQRRLLVIDVIEFGKLTSKYSQKLYETFASWQLDKDILSHRVPLEWLRFLLSIPDGYSDYKIRKQIIYPSVQEINEKTRMEISYTEEKGSKGKAIRYLVFIIATKDDEELDEMQPRLIDDSPVNEFLSYGITDEQFEAIVAIRKEKKKPVQQGAINAYINQLIALSKYPETVSLEEIVGMAIVGGWTGWPKKEWVINPNASVRTNPVPGQEDEKPKQTPQPQTTKSEEQSDAPKIDPNEAFKLARADIKTQGKASVDWPEGVREVLEGQLEDKQANS